MDKKIIEKGIEILEPYPALYIESINAIVISDLHLGYEGSLAKSGGVFLPKTQLKKEMEILEKIVKMKKAGKIILCGDIKHDFAGLSDAEKEEAKELFRFLENNFEKIIIVKGNHDNYLYYIAKDFRIKLVEEYFEKGFLFAHGHKEFSEENFQNSEFCIIGNEHPAIGIFDEVGIKEKIKCFLYGEIKEGKKLIVLPAFAPLSAGTEINNVPKKGLLSPVLRNNELNNFRIIGIDLDAGILDFSTLEKLKKKN